MLGGLSVPLPLALALAVWASALLVSGVISVVAALRRPETRRGLAPPWAWNAVIVIAWVAHWVGALHGRGTL